MLSRYELVQMIAMLFTGTAPLYLMSTTYVLVGALLGAPMGAEFKAALQAASQVCRSYRLHIMLSGLAVHNSLTAPLEKTDCE